MHLLPGCDGGNVAQFTTTTVYSTPEMPWSGSSASELHLCLHRCGSGCVPEARTRARCRCGYWWTAQVQRSNANCGTQPVKPNRKSPGNSLRFLFMAWQTGTKRTHTHTNTHTHAHKDTNAHKIKQSDERISFLSFSINADLLFDSQRNLSSQN